MGCCCSRRRSDDASERTLRAVLCASELEIDSQLNEEFSALLSKPSRTKEEDRRLYMLAREIIIVANLEVSNIHPIDQLRIAAALVAVERQA
jgi:hypothetical protein